VLDGQPRFATTPVMLAEHDWQAVARAAEDMAQVHGRARQTVVRDGGLFESYFKLGPVGKAMWECAAPRWHGIARADMFLTANGPHICELNSDTPSGQAEAVTLSHMFADSPGRDPNRELEARSAPTWPMPRSGIGKCMTGLTVGVL